MTLEDTKTREVEALDTEMEAADRMEFLPTDDEIRSRAHAIYQARCDSGGEGDGLADWIAAECELKARGNGAQQATQHDAGPSEARQSWRPADHPAPRRDQL